MKALTHAPLPWATDSTGEAVVDAAGLIVVDCGAKPSTPRDRAQANAALIALSVTGRSLNLTALRTAAHALRSYQYGNASPDLAQEVADACDRAIADLEAAKRSTPRTPSAARSSSGSGPPTTVDRSAPKSSSPHGSAGARPSPE